MPASTAAGAVSDEDRFVLVVVGCVGLGVLTGSAGLLWHRGVGWLVEHQVLVGAAQHPLLPVPHAGGAGLDLQRVAVVAAVLVGVVAFAVSAGRRAWLRRRQQAAAA